MMLGDPVSWDTKALLDTLCVIYQLTFCWRNKVTAAFLLLSGKFNMENLSKELI